MTQNSYVMNKTNSKALMTTMIILSILMITKPTPVSEITIPILHNFNSDPPKPIDTSLNSRRLLETKAWTAMKVELDYDGLSKYAKGSKNRQRVRIAKELLNSIKKFLETFFKVYASSDGISFGKNVDCAGHKLPKSTGSNFFVTVQVQNNAESSVLATASGCYTDDETGRPVAGVIFLNLDLMRTGDHMRKQTYSVLLHEIFHILGFAWNTFAQFRTENLAMRSQRELFGQTRIGSISFSTIIATPVLTEIRDFFSCPNLSNVPLENQGSSGTAGSHWESTYFQNELMNPFADVPTYLSSWTIALMEFSSWYKIDKAAAEPMVWGKGDGCEHFGLCPTTSEFCGGKSIGSQVCSEDFAFRSTCTQLPTTNCPIHRSYSEDSCSFGVMPDSADDRIESLGAKSSCFVVSDEIQGRTPSCIESSCDQGKIKLKLANGEALICSRSDEIVNIGEGKSIRCPNLTKFCAAKANRCPGDCSNNGYCLVKNKCFCYAGYSGEDCSTKDGAFWNTVFWLCFMFLCCAICNVLAGSIIFLGVLEDKRTGKPRVDFIAIIKGKKAKGNSSTAGSSASNNVSPVAIQLGRAEPPRSQRARSSHNQVHAQNRRSVVELPGEVRRSQQMGDVRGSKQNPNARRAVASNKARETKPSRPELSSRQNMSSRENLGSMTSLIDLDDRKKKGVSKKNNRRK